MEFQNEESLNYFQPQFVAPNYFIPGYTGFCPKFKTESVGKTYGRATHDIMEEMPFVEKRLMPLSYKPDHSDKKQRQKETRDDRIADNNKNFEQRKSPNIKKVKILKPKELINYRQSKHRLNTDIFGSGGENLDNVHLIERITEVKEFPENDAEDSLVSQTLQQKTRYNLKGKCKGYSETYTVHRWFKNMPSAERTVKSNTSICETSNKRSSRKKPPSRVLLESKNNFFSIPRHFESFTGFSTDSDKTFNKSVLRLREIKREMRESQLFRN